MRDRSERHNDLHSRNIAFYAEGKVQEAGNEAAMKMSLITAVHDGKGDRIHELIDPIVYPEDTAESNYQNNQATALTH